MIYEDDLYEGDVERWSQPLWKTEVRTAGGLSAAMAQGIADALEDLAVSVSIHNDEPTDGEQWSVALMTLGKPDAAAIAHRILETGVRLRLNIDTQLVERKDWLLHVHEAFPPMVVGRFFVFGSHYNPSVSCQIHSDIHLETQQTEKDGHRNECGVTETRIPLRIDAATAFGSGEHQTTQGCLLALEKLSLTHRFKSGLDMGCGSGILAIAMAKLWSSIRVTAIDVDPESVVVTRRHAEMNAVEDGMVVEAGDGYAAPSVGQGKPFDVIVANILADPLIGMAKDLSSVLASGGFCVLSGLLERQASAVIAAHEAHGLILQDTLTIESWAVLVLQKP